MARGCSGYAEGSPLRDPAQLLSWQQVTEAIEQANRQILGLPTTDIDAYIPAPLAAATRELLDQTTAVVTDGLRRDLHLLQTGVDIERLPALSSALPRCFRSMYDPPLIKQFIEELQIATEKLKDYPSTYLDNTAQELAAHLLLNTAEAQIEIEEQLSQIRRDHQQPIWMDDADLAGAEIDHLQEEAFEDYDVLTLFEAENGELGMHPTLDSIGGTNLMPQDWFRSFRDQ